MLGMLAGAALRSLLLAAVVGAALQLRRTYNPLVSLVAWTLVLAASLTMPMVTRLASVALPHAMIQVATLPLTQNFVTQPNVASVMARVEQGLSAALAMAAGWSWIALSLYLAVFSVLMLRLFVGLALSWRIVRRAAPIRGDWVGGFDVRVSRHTDAPATFGSVILLPADYAAWTTAKRLAVLAHEGSHVGRHDSAIQLAAAVNRMVFWFNPFAWWLQRHLSDLAEAASDDAAIAGLGDRVGYAEILLEVSGRVPRLPGAVAMARRSAVASRIERILSETPLPAGVDPGGRAKMAGCIVPFSILLSCVIVSRAPPLVTQVPSAANAGGDKVVATDARPLAPAYSVAAVMPGIAVPPPVSTAPTGDSVATGLPPAREPETPSWPRTRRPRPR